MNCCEERGLINKRFILLTSLYKFCFFQFIRNYSYCNQMLFVSFIFRYCCWFRSSYSNEVLRFILSNYVRFVSNVSVCLSVCVYVCVAVCLCVSILQAKRLIWFWQKITHIVSTFSCFTWHQYPENPFWLAMTLISAAVESNQC